VTLSDPLTIGFVATIMLAASVIALIVPARTAGASVPGHALRAE
jgi:ABC-type lipoprotein release transport system permease subunit